jgi:hypothetical protein
LKLGFKLVFHALKRDQFSLQLLDLNRVASYLSLELFDPGFQTGYVRRRRHHEGEEAAENDADHDADNEGLNLNGDLSPALLSL